MHTSDLFRLEGRIAIVTGGGGVYGRLLCRGLGEAGATVVIAGNEPEEGEAAASRLREDGCAAEAMLLDLRDERSINELTERVAATYGRIDILVNCAVSRAGNPLSEIAEAADWATAQQVNGTGVMLMTKAAVRHMRAQRKGSIINVASIMGVVAPYFPMYGPESAVGGLEYAYAKFGMIGMTKWLACYCGAYGIRVNCLSPGGNNLTGTKDEIRSPALADAYLGLTPMNRFTDEDDLKGPIVFLASDASRYVTGHNLIVDGGYTSW